MVFFWKQISVKEIFIYALAKNIKVLNKSDKIYGVDHDSLSVYEGIERNKEFINERIVRLEYANVENLPYHDKIFDYCITVKSINFWSDLPDVLSQINRVLKDGGKFLLLDKTYKIDSFSRPSSMTKIPELIKVQRDSMFNHFKDAGFIELKYYLNKKWSFLAIIAKK